MGHVLRALKKVSYILTVERIHGNHNEEFRTPPFTSDVKGDVGSVSGHERWILSGRRIKLTPKYFL